VSRHPPGNVVAGVGLAVSDRVKDAFERLAPIGSARRAGCQGAVAGLVGTVVMTAGEKVEQVLTGRRNSYVPAHTLQRLLGHAEPRDSDGWNQTMHWGTGVVVGVAGGLVGRAGLRGVRGFLALTGARVAFDHALETATRVERSPWSWPAPLLAVDTWHKAVYALVTGAVVDRLDGRSQHPAHRS
jgi:hypothetical protein